MTREEKLHWLNVEIQTWENDCQSKHPIKETLYAARKALEQEPCEDAVSRKSVITIIQNHWWNCRDIDKLVNELPSVTPQEPTTKKRLKADIVAMLTELKNELIDVSWNMDMYDSDLDFECCYLNDIDEIIQQKINSLEAESEG